MKGFVPTPAPLVDRMVEKLFHRRPPVAGSSLLDPGCGAGAFVEGIIRWCRRTDAPLPRITAIDSDPARVAEARANVGHVEGVTVIQRDFLADPWARFDYIIGNPPYVPITDLTTVERARYRARFACASGRFDLYLLFFEQALNMLAPDGRIVLVTPEKFLYVQTAAPLRRRLAQAGLEEIEFVAEETFPGLVTYPAVTTVGARRIDEPVRILSREGKRRSVHLDPSGGSWMPAASGHADASANGTIADLFARISCGVATGADGVFVVPDELITPEPREFAYPTLSGRELTPGSAFQSRRQMLIPYDSNGQLLPESRLGALGAYLRNPARRRRLIGRTCVARKPWYAFHETPPMEDIRRPKILCKDIASTPVFVVDGEGAIVPRHSLYYLVPNDSSEIDDLCEYLNSAGVSRFLRAHCQRAANDYLRVQSHVLKRVPLPEGIVGGASLRV
ncbi:MAG: Eco57I restriction-modification methylase domain-containing protein [Gemmatimonadales bacterium]